MTSPPGLAPERIAATERELRSLGPGFVVTPGVRHLLAADDAHARENGLVCAGDALTREALAHLIGFAELSHRISCTRVRDMSAFDSDCRVCYILAALPSSLLDPEDSRG